MERFLCVHGHFYQPPRENPWLEAVETQDGAYPYHDWNERITAECYATNSSSRILDGKGLITAIVSNYARMSFDMGPTLLSWLEKNARETYEAVIEADRQSAQWRSGHGSAIAQTYNHTILPLSNSRDKRTQVAWGMADFRRRFGREPEGMWLPETAVDLETLDVLASAGIKFTVLAPHQARRVRRRGPGHWQDVSGGNIDPSRAYACRLPSGGEIALFFYDGPVSRAVAFEGLLKGGEGFAHRLIEGFSERRNSHQLVHIATDGESYGHHHRFGDMALAYALDYIVKKGLARTTNYGEFLELHPPEDEVEIFEHTSWSCTHGVERWRSDCGCSTGAHPGWSQAWRTPLRESLDWLRDRLAASFEQNAPKYFTDPWAARDGYIDVILDRSENGLGEFLRKHSRARLGPEETVKAVKLLEIERHSMLMYTSCGWFFDDLAGIETVQVIQYAARAIQLSGEFLGNAIEEGFIKRLEAARSNVPAEGNGADIYKRRVKPLMLDLHKVAAHYAISSLFEDYPEKTDIYSYTVFSEDYQKRQSGRTELVAGRCRVVSQVTGESETVSFGVLHLGEHDFNCGVRACRGEEPYAEMTGELVSTFESGAFSELVRQIDGHFGVHRYTLGSLFRDEQRNILDTLIKETLDAFEHSYRKMYEDNRILMAFLKEAGMPVTRAFLTAAEFTLNLDLKRMLQSEEPEAAGVHEILEEFGKWGIAPDAVGLEFTFRRTLEREMDKLFKDPSDLPVLTNMGRLVDIALSLPFELNLRTMQNVYYKIARGVYHEIAPRATGAPEAEAWVEGFRAMGRKLRFNLDAILSGKGR